MEQVGAGPIENGHKVIGNNLYAALRQIAQGDLVIFDILITGRQADLDIVVYVNRFDDVDIEACVLNDLLFMHDLVDRPDFTGLLMVQSPYDAGNAGDLLDVGQGNAVVAFAVPAECHLHSKTSLKY